MFGVYNHHCFFLVCVCLCASKHGRKKKQGNVVAFRYATDRETEKSIMEIDISDCNPDSEAWEELAEVRVEYLC